MLIRPGIIYKITNKVDGKSYIGQTTRALARRWGGHKRAAKKGGTYRLHRAINKYGPDAFTVEVIAESWQPFLDALEIFFIRLYNTRSQWGYNLTDGGGGNKGHSHSLETKARMSEAMKGNTWNKGKTHSIEHRVHVSEALKGREITPDSRRKMSEARQGRSPWNKGQKGLQVAWNKGRKADPDRIRKMNEGRRGKPPWNKGRKGASPRSDTNHPSLEQDRLTAPPSQRQCLSGNTVSDPPTCTVSYWAAPGWTFCSQAQAGC
jgi:group I intron endonuclease